MGPRLRSGLYPTPPSLGPFSALNTPFYLIPPSASTPHGTAAKSTPLGVRPTSATIISSSTVSPMTLNLLLLKLSDFHILHLKDRPAPASQMVTEAGENGVQCQAHCGVGAGQR